MGLAMLVKKSHLNADQQEVADIIGLENYQALVDTFGGSGYRKRDRWCRPRKFLRISGQGGRTATLRSR